MGLLGYFRASNDAALLAVRTPADKVDFHIERYTAAIEQCEKGPERLAQLHKERDFWRAVKKAQQSLL
jgi:ribosomal protein L34E